MNDENSNTPKNEAFRWLEPGAWRKPCIVHVTMVANSRQALFGKLSHNGSEAVVEKTAIGRSAHTEAGWFAGSGKLTIVYIPEQQEPELMYKLFSKVCCSIDELIDTLK